MGDAVVTNGCDVQAGRAAARHRPAEAGACEAARKIREQAWGQPMVLVAVTGWGQDQDRRKLRQAELDGHRVKPVDLDAPPMKLLAELQRTPV